MSQSREEADQALTLATIDRGFMAEEFLNSETGRYLVSRSRQERNALTEELVAADPDDRETNRRLRMEIAIRELWIGWLQSAIQEGLMAQEQLHESAG